jgi:uncharacterized delta-60 repeat protein
MHRATVRRPAESVNEESQPFRPDIAGPSTRVASQAALKATNRWPGQGHRTASNPRRAQLGPLLVDTWLVTRTHSRSLTIARACAAAALAAACALAGGAGAGAATSSTVVGATVPSATTLDASTCATSTSATNLGIVLPGATARTAADCVVTFGSSNDTSRLRMFQSDGGGAAMWHPTDGPLDPGIGGGAGYTAQVISGSSPLFGLVYDPAIDRYYATGHASNGVVVARYRPDGTLDTTWAGGTGWMRPLMGNGSTDAGYALALQPDGSVVGTGRLFDSTGGINDTIGAFRLTPSGSLDPTFGGGDGWVEHDYGNPVGVDVELATDGSVFLCATQVDVGPDSGGAVVKLRPDGSLDTSFGAGDSTPGDGVRVLSGAQPWCGALGVTDTGSIYVGGRTYGTRWEATVWRLGPNGADDSTWSGDGRATINVGIDYAEVLDLGVLPDGSAMVAGKVEPSQEQGIVARFTPTGAVDTAWGTNGYRLLSPPSATASRANGLLVLPDGSAYVNGSATVGDADSLLVRLTPGGAVDPAFGSSGYATVAVDASLDDEAAHAVWGRDGRLTAVGSTAGGTARATFVGWPATTVSDYGAGHTWTGAGQGAFAACASAITGATGTGWTADACSTAADGAAWHAVAGDATSGSIATASAGTTTASVSLRFALRTLASQPPGAYFAPVTFEVVAPAT